MCRVPQALSGQCGFLAANLYARSIFGEDALANVSIETPAPRSAAAPAAPAAPAAVPVLGHVRIRAKSQVM